MDILLSNAFKFTIEGYIEIELEESNKGTLYLIHIRDSGIGIDEHLQDEIYKPFDKFDDFKPGIGLGLFIARSIAEHLNINIILNSKKGVGSTFSLEIPIVFDKSVKPTPIKLKDNHKALILVVEDNKDNYFLIEEILKEKYDLIWKKSGFEALEYFSENELDMVILDIMMPGIDGIETCARIRKRDSNIPIVMLSAMIQYEVQESAKKAGANLFIFKPIDIDLENQIDMFFN